MSNTKMAQLRQEICDFLRVEIIDQSLSFLSDEVVQDDGYTRLRIRYQSLAEEDDIPAYLFLPDGEGPFTAVLIHHQHHGERHLGKSEVCGLVGDPLQAFAPALAKAGVVVLAPDSICFEDRRKNRSGTEADEAMDVAQHYNEMCYRLLQGDTLMRKVLNDSMQAISLLRTLPTVDPDRIGIMGHSYGGGTVLFHAALDERIRFACSSGAACTFAHRLANQTGIEMSQVIPGFYPRFDILDLVACMASRPTLLLSATEDKFSQDCDGIVAIAHEKWAMAEDAQLEHLRYQGGHALTQARFKAIVDWLLQFAD